MVVEHQILRFRNSLILFLAKSMKSVYSMRSVGKQVWLVVFDLLDIRPKAKPGVVHHSKCIGVFIGCVH